MKLAEALIQRDQLKSKILLIDDRLRSSLIIQDGTKADEDYNDILNELYSIGNELKSILKKISIANYKGLTSQNRSVAKALIELDILKYIYYNLVEPNEYFFDNSIRYSKREIKYVRTISPLYLREKFDTVADDIKNVKIEILSANWQIDID